MGPMIAHIATASRESGERTYMGERKFVVLPSPNDRVKLPIRSRPDEWSADFRVLFVEHFAKPHPLGPLSGPPTVVVELL